MPALLTAVAVLPLPFHHPTKTRTEELFQPHFTVGNTYLELQIRPQTESRELTVFGDEPTTIISLNRRGVKLSSKFVSIYP